MTAMIQVIARARRLSSSMRRPAARSAGVAEPQPSGRRGGLRSAPVGSFSRPRSIRIMCALGMRLMQLEVVGRDDDGRAQPIERLEQVQQPLGHVGIDVAGRLVGDEDLGPADHRAGDRDRAAARRPTASAGARLPRSVSPTQASISRTGASISLSGTPASAQRQRDIVDRRTGAGPGGNPGRPRRSGAGAGQARARQRHCILAEQADHPARRALRQIQQLEQRRLARARRAGEEIEAPARQREADVAQRLRAGAIAQPHILELHDVRHRVVADRSACCLR